MTSILLSGGAGYIGSATAYALSQAGLTPIVIDDLSRGHRFAVKYGPLVQCDMADTAAVTAAINEYKPAAMIHFAGLIEVAESVQYPEKYMDANFRKAALLFETARAAGVKNVVFSSTAAVYGTPQTDGPLNETQPLSPINPYGESKLAAEGALQALGAQGLSSLILRYFNAAGALPIAEGLGEAHRPETHLIPNALLAGLGLKPSINLFGTDYPTPDGTAVRDYIHVMDLAAAHVAGVRYLMNGGDSTICNLGTGTGYSVAAVIAAVEKALGAPLPVNRGPRRAGDPPRLVADASRARSLLNWKPEKSLDDIVSSALAWHKTETYRTAVQSV